MYRDKLIGISIPLQTGLVEIVDIIKKTSSSTILLGKDEREHLTVVKYVPFYTNYSKELFQKEVNTLRFLGASRQFVQLMDFTELEMDTPTGVLKIEYCSEGNLRQFSSKYLLETPQISHIAREMALGLLKLKQSGVAHLDFSSENILITQDFAVKISDFAVSVPIEHMNKMDSVILKSMIEKNSKPSVRPPDEDLEKYDLYGFGCILYFLLTKRNYEQPECLELLDSCDRILAGITRRCLQLSENRPSPEEILELLQVPSRISWESKFSEVESMKLTTTFCLQNCLAVNERCPDLFYMQYIIQKSWNKPDTMTKFFRFLQTSDTHLTIVAIKVLIIIHRLLISGPLEILLAHPGPKEVIEPLLAHWTNKVAHFQDSYFCEYFSGLIRQMCRILLDKVHIHFETCSQGNWKQPLKEDHLETAFGYLTKVFKICEGLVLGMNGLVELMNFIIIQLTEEGERLLALFTMMFQHELGENTPIGQALNQAQQKIHHINQRLAERLQSEPRSSKKFKTQSNDSDRESISPVHERNPEPILNIPKPAVPKLPEQPVFPEFPAVFGQFPVSPPKKPKEDFIGERWLVKAQEIKTGTVLGSGASCTVYRGIYKRTPVAIKIMRGESGGNSLELEFEREVKAMLMLRHPNLVLFMGACRQPQLIIVSEFCQGESLFKLLHEKRNVQLSKQQRFKMIMDIARGMLYLHEVEPPILHRDLKSLNLLLTHEVKTANDSVEIKITDFGVARILDKENLVMTGQMGTCHWMAPEVLNSEPYSLAADVYSFGIVMFEILARDIPYRNLPELAIPMRVVKGERPNLSAVPTNYPNEIKQLMRDCWNPDPVARPNFNQIMDRLEVIEPEMAN